MKPNDQTELILISQLEKLHATARRDPHAAAATRAAFIVEARNVQQTVSPRPTHRLNIWMAVITEFLAAPKKLRGVPVINTVFTLIVVLGLAFGGGTAAAQTSMPDNMLYPLKIWSEEARISFATDPDTQFQLHMQFAERRMEEIQSMLQNGIQPPDVVMWQFQNQLTHAFSIAAAMADEQLQASLSQLQIRLQEQQRNLTRLQLNSDEAQNLLQTREKIRSMIQEQVQLCQSGLNAPDQFREQLQINEQYHLQQQLHDEIEEPEGNLNQNQHQNQDGVLNMDQNQNQYRDNGNSSPENSIVPPESGEMNGTGPNDGTCPNSSSGDCDCDGTGNLNACDKGGNP